MSIRRLALVVLSTPVAASSEANIFNTMEILKTSGAMLLIIVLIFVLAWLVKKIQPGYGMTKGKISVIANTQLSSHARVCLIQIEDHYFLIGVTNAQVNLIQSFNTNTLSLSSEPLPHESLQEKFKNILAKKS